MFGYLVAVEGVLAGLLVALEEGDRWLLGRDPEQVTVVLEDPSISRVHARCQKTAQGYFLENLSETNAVIRNDIIVETPVLLQEGDRIKIGNSLFLFSSKAPSPEYLQELASKRVPDEPLADLDTAPPTILEAEDLAWSERMTTEEALASVHLDDVDCRWRLKVVSGPNTGAEFGLYPGLIYIVGKDPEACNMVLRDLSVSRKHARVRVDELNQVYIEDQGSRNGVVVNGQVIAKETALYGHDMVGLGTTTLDLVDKLVGQETIIAPSPLLAAAQEREAEQMAQAAQAAKEEAEKEAEAIAIGGSSWKNQVISFKMLLLSGVICLFLLGGVSSLLFLFKQTPIEMVIPNFREEIEHALEPFKDVQFAFNPSQGKLFVAGHVLTGLEKRELFYRMGALTFISNIEDNVVVDEYVWQNMNSLLALNQDWLGISFSASAPGKFVIRGYLSTLEDAKALFEYVTINFPYLDRLEDRVIVEQALRAQIGEWLVQNGFRDILFELVSGEVIFEGQIEQADAKTFRTFLDQVKNIDGIRWVKNFVVVTKNDVFSIDITSRYQVTGVSKKDNQTVFVVINGKVLSVGDYIDGMKIMSIISNSILLEKDGVEYKINYDV